jgi:hypothetical protein
MKHGHRTASIVAAAVLVLLSAHGAFGQSAAFAAFTGQALDPQGASIPGATLTATNVETDILRTTQTTSNGLYRLDNLPPGIYDIVSEARSFTKVETMNVKLQVGEQRDINFNLEPAGEKQLVVVTSEVPLIETTKTDVSTMITDRDVANLPTTTSFESVGNLFNHPGFIFNNSFDVLNLLPLPAPTVKGAPNPNFNCTASCLNPFTGLYLGSDGQPLTLAKFQRATFNAAKNFNGLGGPAGEVSPRIIQLAVLFRW